jgi:hypothetical protein
MFDYLYKLLRTFIIKHKHTFKSTYLYYRRHFKFLGLSLYLWTDKIDGLQCIDVYLGDREILSMEHFDSKNLRLLSLEKIPAGYKE